MSIWVDKNTKLLVQGITGSVGAFHTKQMLEYGTKIVGGVTPGKAGSKIEGVPVFHTVADAVKATGANATVVYVPPAFAGEPTCEATDARTRRGGDGHHFLPRSFPVQSRNDVQF